MKGSLQLLVLRTLRGQGVLFSNISPHITMLGSDALDRGIAHRQVNSSLVDEAARDVVGQPIGLDNETIQRALDVAEFVRSRDGIGGPAPGEVRRIVQTRIAERMKEGEELDRVSKQIEHAHNELKQAVHNITG